MHGKRWTLIAVVLGSGIVFLDSTVVNVALPRMGRELDSSFFGVLEAQSYVYYGYLLTLSALLILAGGLTDFYGRRRMFVTGLTGFGITSVLCGLAPSMEVLIVCQVLQGAAGALLVPGSLAIITASFTGEEQGRAFGIWAGASAATTILGPALGGALVAYTSWRAVFFINVPLLAVAIWASVRHIEETRDEEASGAFDWAGAVIAVLALGGLTFGVIRGQATSWTSAVPLASLAIGAGAAIAFPFLMARVENPLVPLILFKSRNFTVTNISTFVIYGSLYVTFQFLALFMIGTLGYNELAFGIASIPGSLFLVFLSARAGALAARHGPRVFMAVGPAIMGVGILWFVRIPVGSSPWVAELADPASLLPTSGYVTDVLPALVVFGIGLTIMVAPLTTALMRSVPVHRSGVASAINNAISRVGPQLMGALLFVAITASFYASLEERAPDVEVSSPVVRQEISPLNRPPEDLDPSTERAAREASTDAFHIAMGVAGLLCLLGAVVNAVGIRNELLHDHDLEPEAAAATAT